MANTFRLLKKCRALIVGASVMALLSSPLLTRAGNTSTLYVEGLDSIAGLSTEISYSNAGSFKTVEVTVTEPDGDRVVLQSVSDENGEGDFTLSNEYTREAGQYKLSARQNGDQKSTGYGQFEVHAGSVSVNHSTVALSQNSVKLGETVELKVTLKDNFKNPIEGHMVQVLSNRLSDDIYSKNTNTDQNGEINFYISNELKGISEFTIMDTSSRKTLKAKPRIAFKGTESLLNSGGYASIILATDGEDVDHFNIDIESNIEMGEYVDFTVTAVDEDEVTVTDYTGSIEISTTDANADLTEEYSFTDEDLGTHTFELGARFLTNGEQTLSVTDSVVINVTGEASFTVGEESSSNNASDEADFKLIAPASGSYSEDNLEVQGEAPYGYWAVAYLDDEESARSEVEFDDSFNITLEDIADGIYELRVDIVEVATEGEVGEEEILEVVQISEIETIEIDTTVPEIIEIELDENIVTLLSEADLEEASVLIDGDLFEMTESSTAGKYEVEISLPEEAGDYSLDVILMDRLGNEVQYRDQLILRVNEDEETSTSSPTEDSNKSKDSENDTLVEPGTVENISLISSEEEVRLTWEAPETGSYAIDHYKIKYGPSPSSLYAVSETFDSATSWFIPNLSGGQIYYFTVTAVDTEDNEGSESAAVSAVPLAKALTEVPSVSAPAISSTGTPETTPDTGPGMLGLAGISMGSAFLYRRKRKSDKLQRTF